MAGSQYPCGGRRHTAATGRKDVVPGQYGALKEDEAQRLKALKLENARLKRIVAEQFHVSQRRACAVMGQVRSTQRYTPVPSDFETRLVKQMHVHAGAHPRWQLRRRQSMPATRWLGWQPRTDTSTRVAGPQAVSAADATGTWCVWRDERRARLGAGRW
jgi:hypothetical protein